jgi:hypothetical protein
VDLLSKKGSLYLEDLATSRLQICTRDKVVCMYTLYSTREANAWIYIFENFFFHGSATRTEFESETLILGEKKCAKFFT